MWLSDFQVVLNDRVLPTGSVRIEDGLIVEISQRRQARDVNGNGLILIPGLVDMHGDMVEKELEPRPQVNFQFPFALQILDRRLAAAGITTAYAAVSFSAGSAAGQLRSFEHTSEILRQLDASREELKIDHKVHARFDMTFDDAVSVVTRLVADGVVDLLSFTDHTPGQGQYRDLGRFTKMIAYRQGISHAQARQQISSRIAERSRPVSVVENTLQEVSRCCRKHNVTMASHDDDTVDKVRLMHELGVRISEFPVTAEAAREVRKRGLMRPLSSRLIVITAERGSASPPSGQSPPGCWIPTNIVRRSADQASPVNPQPFGPVMKRAISHVTGSTHQHLIVAHSSEYRMDKRPFPPRPTASDCS